jgi:hypothetical protein
MKRVDDRGGEMTVRILRSIDGKMDRVMDDVKDIKVA